MDTLQAIFSAARRRSENWAATAPDPVLARDLTERLDGLYQKLRLERARYTHGDPVEIRRRARIEREIERLMSDNTGIE